jgi:hypothetical protein
MNATRLAAPEEIVTAPGQGRRQPRGGDDQGQSWRTTVMTMSGEARLPFSHRKEHVRAIDAAKSAETRMRRILKAVQMVRATGREGL